MELDENQRELIRQIKLSGEAIEEARGMVASTAELRRGQIRDAISSGISVSVLAKELGLRREYIYQVLNRGKK